MTELADAARRAARRSARGGARRICTAATAGSISRCSRSTSRRPTTSAVALGAALTTHRAPRHGGRRLRDRHQHLERRRPASTRSSRSSARARCAARSTTDEVTFYTTAYGSSTDRRPAAYADLIGVFLTAPEFLYFVEHGDTAVAGQTGVYDVSPYELASRLSYQLWQTAPDDALLAAAADGSLLDADDLQRAGDAPARRSARAPGAGRVLRRLDEGRGPARDGREERRPDVQDVRGRRPARRQAAPGDDRRRASACSTTTPGRRRPGSSALLTSDLSFARDARLAKLYGVAAWNGTGAPPALPAGQRPGPAHARAVSLDRLARTRGPIMKGVFMRTNILCDDDPAAAARRQRQAARARARHDHARERRGDHRDAGDGLRRLPRARRSTRSASRPRGSTRSGASARRSACSTPAAPRPGRSRSNTMTVPQVVYGDHDGGLDAGRADVADARPAARSRPAWRATSSASRTPAGRTPTTDGCALEDARKALANGGNARRPLAAAAVKTAAVPAAGVPVRRRTRHGNDRVIDISRRQMLRGHRRRHAGAAGPAVAALPRRPTAPTRCSRGRRACTG